MLLRGQNLLGYRHFADDTVDKFVERAALNGVDVFRIVDALNDWRNFGRAIDGCVANGKHAQAAISSMSMTYGHSPTETIVAAFRDLPRDTGLDMKRLDEVAIHFRDARKKYARFEGSLKCVDSRILVAQVPGGMLTNMESQLRAGALARMDEVIAEIPRVGKTSVSSRW